MQRQNIQSLHPVSTGEVQARTTAKKYFSSRFDVGWQLFRYRDAVIWFLGTRLMKECISEVVHWYEFEILGQDVTKL